MEEKDKVTMDERYKELWREGYRTEAIFKKIAVEYGYSVHTLYKIMNVKELKKEAITNV